MITNETTSSDTTSSDTTSSDTTSSTLTARDAKTGTAAPRSTRRRRTVRSFAFVLSTAAATVAAVGAGFAPTSAQADPGDTRLPIGTSQLVQSEDLSSINMPLNTLSVEVNQDEDFSACLGEGNPWTGVLKGSPKPINAAWTRRGHDSQAVFETIAQAKDVKQAKAFTATLVTAAIKDCQKPKFDFHYGKITTDPVGDGVASWAVLYRGTSTKAEGGVAVIRKGSNVGIVSVSGKFGPADQTMESVAKVATDRLVYSS